MYGLTPPSSCRLYIMHSQSSGLVGSNLQRVSRLKGFVNISASCIFEETCERSNKPDKKWSLRPNDSQFRYVLFSHGTHG